MDLSIAIEREERDFIRALIRRERWAQRALYEQYYSSLMSVCLRYAGSEDEAMDLLHESFLKVFRHIGKYQTGTSLVAWMRRIVVNTAIDQIRKNNRRRTEDLDTAYDLSTPDPDAVSRCTEQEILAAVQELSPTYRAVFNLYVLDGFNHKEIADKLGINESTSRSNLVKARARLQEVLTAKHYRYDR